MLDVVQFRLAVVRPAIEALGLWSPAAENLLVGIALAESRLVWLEQLGGGPARGLFQIEPGTERDVWGSYLLYRPGLAAIVLHALAGDKPDLQKYDKAFIEGWRPAEDQLTVNLAYSAMIARLIYLRRPEPIPTAGYINGLAAYWKLHFNTRLGAGRAATFASRYRRYVLGDNRKR